MTAWFVNLLMEDTFESTLLSLVVLVALVPAFQAVNANESLINDVFTPENSLTMLLYVLDVLLFDSNVILSAVIEV